MNYEDVFFKSYKEAYKYLEDINRDKKREDTVSIDDYFEDGFIEGMEKVLSIMYQNHQKEIEKESNKIKGIKE